MKIKRENKRRDIVTLIRRRYHKDTFFFVVACCCGLATDPGALIVILAYLVLFAKFVQVIGLYNNIIGVSKAAQFAVIGMNFVIILSAISRAN